MTEKWYHRAIEDLEQKYENAKPHDMKDFNGLIDAKGYCSKCNKKDVLTYNRKKRQLLCIDCDELEPQYFPYEMANMWDVAHELLYYFKQLANEMDEIK